MDRRERDLLATRLTAIGLSLLVGTVLMGLKFLVYWMTRSSAVLSDALESIINVAAAGFALGSILWASKPPDKDHPYGHGKIEYFSAGFEGALIIVAAGGIFYTGFSSLLDPRPIPHLENGLWLLLVTSFINLFLGILLVKTGRRTESLTLVADGQHVLTDVYTSAGVLAGLLLIHLTGWNRLDGLVALAVGIHILFTGGKLVRQSFAGLMDASDPELLEEIASLLDGHRGSLWIDIHQLRAWRSGHRVHVDFHLILPRDLSLEESHREVKEAEALFKKHFGGPVEVLVHTDPCMNGDCPVCSRRMCELRREAYTETASWRRDRLTDGDPRGALSIERERGRS